jgi:hypothetical protein
MNFENKKSEKNADSFTSGDDDDFVRIEIEQPPAILEEEKLQMLEDKLNRVKRLKYSINN